MGKTIKNKYELKNNVYKFNVLVRVHGKTHTEIYSIPKSDLSRAKDLGYFNGTGKNEVYYDWKPLNKDKDFKGGLISVDKYTFDDKYVYAHAGDQKYSLPKYLFSRLGEKNQILVGKRES